MTKIELAQMIDHTNLKAVAGDNAMKKLCDEARQYGFKAVAVNGANVKRCVSYLAGTGVNVAAVVGFPLGQSTTAVKLAELKTAVADGAKEIDYVINIADLQEGRLEDVRDEMKVLTQTCHEQGAKIKVIFENCYLTDAEIKCAAEIARAVKPDFIKTSTGFGTGGATIENVALMKSIVGDEVQVKAAGGIRDWRAAKAMITAGATRLGTSAGVKIIDEFINSANGRA